MSRLPSAPDTAGSDAFAVFEEIRSTRGFLSNVLRSLGNAPGGLRHLARLGAYCKYETDLPERQRELAILCAARGVPYAWTHHAALAVQTGIPASAIAELETGVASSALPVAEQALARYVFALTAPNGVADEIFSTLRTHFTPRQITDITLSATYYGLLANVVRAFDVPLESDDVLHAEQDWQKTKAGL